MTISSTPTHVNVDLLQVFKEAYGGHRRTAAIYDRYSGEDRAGLGAGSTRAESSALRRRELSAKAEAALQLGRASGQHPYRYIGATCTRRILSRERLLLAHGRRSSALQRDCLLSGGYPTRQRGSSEPPAATESDS